MTYYYNNTLSHAEWKKHKYIRKEGNTYIYPEDLQKGNKEQNAAYWTNKSNQAKARQAAVTQKVAINSLRESEKTEAARRTAKQEAIDIAKVLTKSYDESKSNSGYSEGMYYRKSNGGFIQPSKEYYDEYISNGGKLTPIGSRYSVEQYIKATTGQTQAQHGDSVAAEVQAGAERGARIGKIQERIEANESGKATSGELKALTKRTGTVAEQAQKAREAALSNMRYNQRVAADKTLQKIIEDGTSSKVEKVMNKVLDYFTDQTVTVKNLFDDKYNHTETYTNEAGIKKDARKAASAVKSAVSKGEQFLSKIFKK